METAIRAVALAGGVAKLSERLHIPRNEITSWMNGGCRPPPGAFLELINFLIDEERKPRRHAAMTPRSE